MGDSTVTATDLKARCGRIIDAVARDREVIVVTRRGRPVARIVPIESPAARSIFGFAAGSVVIHGDIMSPIDVVWDASE